MNGDANGYPWLILIVGLTMLAALGLRKASARLKLPAMVGYIGIGLALNSADRYWIGFPHAVHDGLQFLASAGIIALLFRVGLQSNLPALIAQLRRASFVWSGDVLFSGAIGFVTARYLLDLALIPSLFAAAALTATSIGVSTAVWQDEGALNSRTAPCWLTWRSWMTSLAFS